MHVCMHAAPPRTSSPLLVSMASSLVYRSRWLSAIAAEEGSIRGEEKEKDAKAQRRNGKRGQERWARGRSKNGSRGAGRSPGRSLSSQQNIEEAEHVQNTRYNYQNTQHSYLKHQLL